ncbi:FecR domain-containing protein [Pontibacterium sp.]|uniref:FecR family protein n=1 Tax=Pontibacterium sp. TaxID=2036026 RepID=UPI00351546D2
MLRVWVLLLALTTSFSSVAAESIGRVILSLGDNKAYNLRGLSRDLKRDDLVYEKERLVTGVRGRLHIRFNDGSSINMKPESNLQLSRYQFEEKKPEQGQAVFQLMRGGLRTISGKIGKSNPDNYRFQTVLATIGIRGTEYEVYVCDRCCAEKYDVTEGVAGGVDEGGIHVNTAVGNADLNPGLFFELARGASGLNISDARPAMLAIGDEKPYVKPQPVKAPEPAVMPAEQSVEERCSGLTDFGELDAEMEEIWGICGNQATGGS